MDSSPVEARLIRRRASARLRNKETFTSATTSGHQSEDTNETQLVDAEGDGNWESQDNDILMPIRFNQLPDPSREGKGEQNIDLPTPEGLILLPDEALQYVKHQFDKIVEPIDLAVIQSQKATERMFEDIDRNTVRSIRRKREDHEARAILQGTFIITKQILERLPANWKVQEWEVDEETIPKDFQQKGFGPAKVARWSSDPILGFYQCQHINRKWMESDREVAESWLRRLGPVMQAEFRIFVSTYADSEGRENVLSFDHHTKIIRLAQDKLKSGKYFL